MTFRIFLLGEDETLSRISQRKYEEANNGKPTLAAFANQRLKIAFVFLPSEGPVGVEHMRIETDTPLIDENGAINGDWQLEAMRDAVGASDEEVRTEGSVLHVEGLFARRRRDQETWKPTPEQDRMLREMALAMIKKKA